MKSDQSKNKKTKQTVIQNQKEESIREILTFFTNQVDLKAFMKKKKMFDNVGETDVKHQNDFLNATEYSEIKGIYQDYNIGDLALVFPNPDFKGCEQKAVTFKEAAEIFDQILTVMTEEVTKSQLKKERKSYLLAYLTLDELIENENELLLAKKKKKIKNNKTSKQPFQKAQLNQTESNEEKPKVNEKTSYEKYLNFMRIYLKQKEELRQMENEGYDAKHDKEFLDEIGVDQEQQQSTGKVLDPIKELMKVDVDDDSQFKKVKKKWSQGGFLVHNESENKWNCNNGPPRDVLTLIRFTILEKLSRNGFLHCRQFISKAGDYIYVVLKSTKQVISRQAQNIKATKQIEMGFADLFSLEPVDDNFRPFRLKNYVRQLAGPNYSEIKEQMDKIQMQKKNFNNIEEIDKYCKEKYIEIRQVKDLKLRAQVIKKQEQVDEQLKIITKHLNLDVNHEKAEINSDYEISEEEWQIYYIYMEYLLNLLQFIQTLKTYCFESFTDNLPFLYRLAFRKSFGCANQIWYSHRKSCWTELINDKAILRNLWDKLELEPVAPYTQFFQMQNDIGKFMWRKYEINEKKDRSEFNNMEKIKITNAIILKHINIAKLLQSLIAVAYFPIHDIYALSGQKKENYLTTLEDQGFIIFNNPPASDDSLKELADIKAASESDKIKEKSKKYNLKEESTKGSQKLSNELGHSLLLYMYQQLQPFAESTDFDFQSVEQDFRINFRCPWYIPVYHLRDYFGEKIALYFAFLSFYTEQLWYIGVVGIFCQALLAESTGKYKKPMIFLFAFSIVIWSTAFIVYWRRKQYLFSVQFGQLNFESDEALRPAFQGEFQRSMTNDDLNEQFYPPFKRKITQLFGLGVSFLIIACVIGCVLGIFFFKNQMIENKASAFFSQTLPGLLNSILIGFFNFIYQLLVMVFNNLENHKILSTYENSLVAKVFIFRFVNTFNSFFISSFLSSYFSSLELCKVDAETVDCFQIVSNQLSTIFISNFTGIITAVAVPFVTLIIKRLLPVILENMEKQKQNKNNENEEEIIENDLEEINQIISPFEKIDSFIEGQFCLQPYQTNEEVDGSVNDYMELTIQFCFLILFGVSYPACFILAFAQNVGRIQANKITFLKLSRRPFPQGAASIGNWLIILEIVTFFGILTNAGLVVYTSNSVENHKIEYFAALLVIFFSLTFIIKIMVSPESESSSILLKRHSYIINRSIKGFVAKGKYKQDRNQLNIEIQRVGYHLINSNVINSEFLQTIKEKKSIGD